MKLQTFDKPLKCNPKCETEGLNAHLETM